MGRYHTWLKTLCSLEVTGFSVFGISVPRESDAAEDKGTESEDVLSLSDVSFAEDNENEEENNVDRPDL